MENENAVVKNQVILNLIQDLQRLLLHLISNVRGRFQIKFGMTSLCNNGGCRGFTLIELLVVVLIIGILAAVAVPQYQLAVAKIRAKRLLPLMHAIISAQQEYYLANGTYAKDFSLLTVDMPTATQICDIGASCRQYKDFTCYFASSNWESGSISCTLENPSIRIMTPFGNEYWACWDDGDASSFSARVCKAVSGSSFRQSNGAWTW